MNWQALAEADQTEAAFLDSIREWVRTMGRETFLIVHTQILMEEELRASSVFPIERLRAAYALLGSNVVARMFWHEEMNT
jgi:hypothetical protein